jgi:hypothetical protein
MNRMSARICALAVALGVLAVGCASPDHPTDAWHENYRARDSFAWWTPPDPMLDLWTLPYPPPPEVGQWSDPYSDVRTHYGEDAKPDVTFSR